MFKIIKKADIVLFIILIAIGLALSWFSIAGSVTGQKAVVTVDGKTYGTYSLSRDQNVTIKHNGHINKFSIKGGYVQMTYSSCKNQICVDKGKINQTSQSIVCLPNKVVITIQGGDSKYDAVSN
jgi:hypothetical protein